MAEVVGRATTTTAVAIAGDDGAKRRSTRTRLGFRRGFWHLVAA